MVAIGRFHLLTDYYFQQRYSHAELSRMAISGGADTIQFRQKFGGIRHRLREASKAADVCRERGVPLLINDTLDLALAVGAAGVHLGQADFPIADARRILSNDSIIGATASTLQEALHAWEDGASYIGFGPIFPTRSKANPVAVRGLVALEEVCRTVGIPVIAIAGITASRVSDVMSAGAHGIAVMTAVTTASDPESAAREISDAIARAVD